MKVLLLCFDLCHVRTYFSSAWESAVLESPCLHKQRRFFRNIVQNAGEEACEWKIQLKLVPNNCCCFQTSEMMELFRRNFWTKSKHWELRQMEKYFYKNKELISNTSPLQHIVWPTRNSERFKVSIVWRGLHGMGKFCGENFKSRGWKLLNIEFLLIVFNYCLEKLKKNIFFNSELASGWPWKVTALGRLKIPQNLDEPVSDCDVKLDFKN